MTEPNWATEEMSRWLSNNEKCYNEIMSAPQDMRLDTIKGLAHYMRTRMPHFTDVDYADIDWDSLAEDFADETITEDDTERRYIHSCNACSFLGRHGDDDLYWHDDTIEKFIFVCRETGACTTLKPEDAEALNAGLLMAEAMGLYHPPGTKAVTKGWIMSSYHAADLMELAIRFANPNAVIERDENVIKATVIQPLRAEKRFE